jgi:hypothetical protein
MRMWRIYSNPDPQFYSNINNCDNTIKNINVNYPKTHDRNHVINTIINNFYFSNPTSNNSFSNNKETNYNNFNNNSIDNNYYYYNNNNN